MSTHACAIPGCAEQIPNGKLMCLDHWRLVPKPLQREVNQAWRGFMQNQSVEHRLAARKRYLSSVDVAVKAVVDLLAPVQ